MNDMTDPEVLRAPAAQLPVRIDAEKLIMHALDKNVPIESLERLLALRDKLIAEAAKGAYLDALSRFQAECPVIPKRKRAEIRNKDGDDRKSYSYMYAPIDAIAKIAAPLLTKHGLSYKIDSRVEGMGKPGAYMVVRCTGYHVGGHSEFSEFMASIDSTAKMNDLQKHAAALTFGKRQSFCDCFGILTGDHDDDGKTGGGKGKQAEPEDDGGLPFYPDDKFVKALPEWKKLLESGKTVDQIKATVGSKYRFTTGQEQRLSAAAGAQK